jgi:hypothetical protein
MKKRLSYFAYNQRDAAGWSLYLPFDGLEHLLCSIMKTVTYVLGTFVTLVSSPYKGGHWGICRRCFESGAAHFHLLCCTDWYMNYFALIAFIALGHFALTAYFFA